MGLPGQWVMLETVPGHGAEWHAVSVRPEQAEDGTGRLECGAGYAVAGVRARTARGRLPEAFAFVARCVACSAARADERQG